MKGAAIISKIRHFTNLNSLKLIYYALVYPYLIYGNLIWGYTYKTLIKKLMNIQKKILRLMTFKSYFDSCEPIFNNLQILDLFKLNEYLTSLFMIRYFYFQIYQKYLQTISCPITKFIVIAQETHQCYTKNATEQITQNTLSQTKELKFGIIFQQNIKNLDLMFPSKKYLRNIF